MATEHRPWQSLPRPWVLDVGSGGAPFPLANILLDLYPEDGTVQRNVPLKVEPGQIFVQGDAHHLPFGDGEIDFIYTSDLLEHVEDPGKVVQEMLRVSPRGVILIPSVPLEGIIQIVANGKNSNGHKWLCRSEGSDALGFMRCDNSQKEAIRYLLTKLGQWPEVHSYSYNTNIFHAWGWGGWPNAIQVNLYNPSPESLKTWGTIYRFGGATT